MNVFANTLDLAKGAAAGASYTSNYYQLDGISAYSIQIGFSSATLNGTLTLEASNSLTIGFTTITGTSQAIASGVIGFYNVPDANYKYVRFKWTYTSGTGTLDAVLVIKAEIS